MNQTEKGSRMQWRKRAMARHIPKFDPTDPALLEAIQKEQARRSMARFALYTDPRYKMNWHHRLICDRLDQWIRHKIKRLMIFMPPRHGKSELVSRKLPAYIFGINPDASIIGTSYSADLATAMNRDVQRIIDSEIYNSLFPETTLNGSNIRTVSGSALRNSDKFEIVGHRGMYRSAGVDGGITGMGGDYIIIDDPIKNRQDANSQTMRQHVWDWYTSTLYTRLEK
ncbi:MAG: terminase family protein, partial [Selenomonas sp.]|nr:terminase family protein [Selenomonas sp.]